MKQQQNGTLEISLGPWNGTSKLQAKEIQVQYIIRKVDKKKIKEKRKKRKEEKRKKKTRHSNRGAEKKR